MHFPIWLVIVIATLFMVLAMYVLVPEMRWSKQQCSLCLQLYAAPRNYQGELFKRVTGGEKDSETGEITPTTGVVRERLCPECSRMYREQMDDLMGNRDAHHGAHSGGNDD